jgi:hypothetical protein
MERRGQQNSKGRERVERMRLKASEVGDWLRQIAGKREYREVLLRRRLPRAAARTEL